MKSERKIDKSRVATCPKCGTFMDKITAWVCSNCGGKTKSKRI
jgi:rubrerythrin